MKLALNHQLFLISLSLRGFALLELEVEVSLEDSAVTNGQPQYENHLSQLSGEIFSGAAGGFFIGVQINWLVLHFGSDILVL